VFGFSKIHLSKTGFYWNRSPTVITVIPPNGSLACYPLSVAALD